MEKKKRRVGRFLPSRVYARWTWTVRFGLTALPMILFLAGGLVFYLTPNRYASTAGFEYLGKRPLAEVEALLKSRNVISRAVSATEFAASLQVDMETAVGIVSENLETSMDPASGMIELTVTNTLKELARDLAVELPKSVEAYEKSLALREIESRMDVLGRSVRDAEDAEEELRRGVVQAIRSNGDPPVNSLAKLNIDGARRDWESGQNHRLDLQARYKDAIFEMENPGKWVAVHSEPQISQTPVGKKPDESLGMVILQSLGIGLAFALIVPYLLELAFPRRIRPFSPTKIKVRRGMEFEEVSA